MHTSLPSADCETIANSLEMPGAPWGLSRVLLSVPGGSKAFFSVAAESQASCDLCIVPKHRPGLNFPGEELS